MQCGKLGHPAGRGHPILGVVGFLHYRGCIPGSVDGLLDHLTAHSSCALRKDSDGTVGEFLDRYVGTASNLVKTRFHAANIVASGAGRWSFC